MEELYDNVIKKLQNDLHPDDFHDLMRGKIKKQIIEMVIKEYTDLGVTDLEFITNRVRDRFGLGFDPNSSIEDKVLRDLEYMMDYERNLKGASPNKIFRNEYKTIERMKGEKSAAIAKQMIDQYRYKVKNNMKLIEAKEFLHSKGYLLEYINKEEISPEKHELIEEILDDPMCDTDLDYYTLADWSIDDLENYKNELNDLHNEERYVNDPYGIDESTEDRFMFKCNRWQPLKNVDPDGEYGPYRDEYNKNYYVDDESYIYVIHYEDDEYSAELYRLDHDTEEFVGTIPNVEDEDFKAALEGETIGIELDPYHYT